MHNFLNFLFVFIFVFSILGVIRLLFNFISSLLSTPPKPFEMNNYQLLMNASFISYIITYTIYLLS